MVPAMTWRLALLLVADQDMIEIHPETHKTKLRDFFGTLNGRVMGTTKAHKNELTSFFSGLSPTVDIAKRAQKEMDRRVATKFSIFDYFHERETDLSRVFAGLLKPSGSHGQGDRFLSLFLNIILPLLKNPLPEYSLPSDLHKCKVHLEYSTLKRRRIDIVLEMPDNHWIGIENKPWAQEREEQVEAYLEFLLSQANEGGTAWILYLSGDGSDPKTLPKEEEKKKFCLTVPYRKNNRGVSLEYWIELCRRECEAERVRWFLKDLLEYIQRNFGKENQVMAQDVIFESTKEFLLDNDGKYLGLALQVEKAMPLIKVQLINGVKEGVKKELKEWCVNKEWQIVSNPDSQRIFSLQKGSGDKK